MVVDKKEEEKPSTLSPLGSGLEGQHKGPPGEVGVELPTSFPPEVVESQNAAENELRDRLLQETKIKVNVARRVASEAYKEWQTLVAKQEAIQRQLDEMTIRAKKQKTEAKVAEIEALERAMQSEAVQTSSIPEPPPPQAESFVFNDDADADIPLPSFGGSSSKSLDEPAVESESLDEPSSTLDESETQGPIPAQEETVENGTAQVENEQLRGGMFSPNANIESEASESTPVKEEEQAGECHTSPEPRVKEPVPQIDEPSIPTGTKPQESEDSAPRVVELSFVEARPIPQTVNEPKIVESGMPMGESQEARSRTVVLTHSTTRGDDSGCGGERGDDTSRTVEFCDEKPAPAVPFDYQTMTPETAKSRWESFDRARGSRVSVAQLKAYCSVLGLTFQTPKRATFCLVKKHFASVSNL
jgi:hypothetical protein